MLALVFCLSVFVSYFKVFFRFRLSFLLLKYSGFMSSIDVNFISVLPKTGGTLLKFWKILGIINAEICDRAQGSL